MAREIERRKSQFHWKTTRKEKCRQNFISFSRKIIGKEECRKGICCFTQERLQSKEIQEVIIVL